MTLESAINKAAHVWGIANMSFGERLRAVRAKQNLTAKDLAARSGVPEKAIYRIETGEVKDPGISTVEKLVKALSCTADEILFDTAGFNGNERLRQLFEETSKTTKGNQELVTQLVIKLNLADRLRFEMIRSDVEHFLTSPGLSWQNEDGTSRHVKLEDMKLDAETEEYFRKNPTSPEAPDGD